MRPHPVDNEVLAVTLATTSDDPHQDSFSGQPSALRAAVGDTLVIGEGLTGTPRVGEIVEVISPDGAPPYRVRWLAGEYESLVSPGPEARVQKGRG